MPKAKAPDPLREIQIQRSIFREHFSTRDGPEILAWIGNYCGAWSQDPARIKPELLAFWNTLLGMAGIVHTENLRTIAQKLLEASNDEDIVIARRAAKMAKED
jgi:hypothetical protein